MATKQSRGRPRIDGDIYDEIVALSLKGWAPAQIHRKLESQPQFAGRVPVLRTVQRVVARHTWKDMSGTWSMVDAAPEEAALVLPVLTEIVTLSEGRIRSVSKGVAHWIGKLRESVPDLPLWDSYMLALEYARRVEQGLATDGLDALLVFAPWRGRAEKKRLRIAVNAGWVPRSQAFVLDWGLHKEARDAVYEKLEKGIKAGTLRRPASPAAFQDMADDLWPEILKEWEEEEAEAERKEAPHEQARQQ